MLVGQGGGTPLPSVGVVNQTFKPQLYNDGQSFSRFYDLDAWWKERIKELPLNQWTTPYREYLVFDPSPWKLLEAATPHP